VGGGGGGSDELDVGGNEVDDGGTGLENNFSYASFSLFPSKREFLAARISFDSLAVLSSTSVCFS
jgi:hypothetical protein